NVFLTAPDAPDTPVLIWSPVPGESCQLLASDLSKLQKFYPAYNPNGCFLKRQLLPFKSTEIGNFELVNDFFQKPGKKVKAGYISPEIVDHPGMAKKSQAYIGAYPPPPGMK
nr:hypothetical protein [Prolixibacteraceae bacterium]